MPRGRILPSKNPGRSNWSDRVRENSVVRTFGPLSGTFRLDLPRTTICHEEELQRGRSGQNSSTTVPVNAQCSTDAPKTLSLRHAAIAIRLFTSLNNRNPDKINTEDLSEVYTLVIPPRVQDKATQTADLNGNDPPRSIYNKIITASRNVPPPKPEDAQDLSTEEMTRTSQAIRFQVTERSGSNRSKAYKTEGGDEKVEVPRSPGGTAYYVVVPRAKRLRATTQQKSQDAQGEGEASVEIPIEGGAAEGGGGQQDGGGGLLLGGAGGRKLSSPVEVTSVSYLSVPDTNSSRRPSTADMFIEKLQVEKVEGGGLSIQGVALASHCHVTLCVFGVFFMLAGVILSYVSYSVTVGKRNHEGEGEGKADEPEHLSSVSQMRMIGPSFLVLGLLMLGLGISLFVLAKKISRDEKVKQLVISEQQLCQLEDSFSYAKTVSPLRTHAPAPHQQYPILAVRRNSWWMDPSLKDKSAAQVDARDTGVQCPSPIG